MVKLEWVPVSLGMFYIGERWELWRGGRPLGRVARFFGRATWDSCHYPRCSSTVEMSGFSNIKEAAAWLLERAQQQ